MQRPKRITLIGTLALVYGVVSLPLKVFAVTSPQSYQLLTEWTRAIQAEAILPLPLAVHLLHGLVGAIVWIVGGVFLLKGRNWSRWLCVFWSAGVLLLTLMTVGAGASFFLKTLVWLCLSALLLGGRSRAYFHASANQGARNPGP